MTKFYVNVNVIHLFLLVYLCGMISNSVEYPLCKCSDLYTCRVIELDNSSNSVGSLLIKIEKEKSMFILQQKVCSSCGYTLDILTDIFKETNILKYTGSSEAVPTSLLPIGASKVMCYNFSILSEGTVNIGFNYYQQWEKSKGLLTNNQITIANENFNQANFKFVSTTKLTDVQLSASSNPKVSTSKIIGFRAVQIILLILLTLLN
jgi:hypothetical protein